MRLVTGYALLRVSATGSCRDTHIQHHQREGEETLVDASEPLPVDEQPPEGAQPGAGPLYSIALSIVVLVCEHGPSALGSPACRPSLGRNTHPDPTPRQRASKRATIISPIRDQFLWTPPGPASTIGTLHGELCAGLQVLILHLTSLHEQALILLSPAYTAIYHLAN